MTGTETEAAVRGRMGNHADGDGGRFHRRLRCVRPAPPVRRGAGVLGALIAWTIAGSGMHAGIGFKSLAVRQPTAERRHLRLRQRPVSATTWSFNAAFGYLGLRGRRNGLYWV